MFDKILVPIDGSSDSWMAVDHAISLAREENAKILGLYIADERVIYAPCWSAAGLSYETLRDDQAFANEKRVCWMQSYQTGVENDSTADKTK